MPSAESAEFQIRLQIDRWVVWRDSGDFDRLLSIWHEDGRMKATWFDGLASEFVDRSKAAWERGVNVSHLVGGTAIDLADDRALAQTKMVIVQCATIHGELCEVSCTGRFFDLFERRNDNWGLQSRQCIYESDKITFLGGGIPELDRDLLVKYPEGYRHLAYVQRQAGMTVATNLPGRRGPELDALYERGRVWLATGSLVYT